ncbi:Penicillin-binding protein PbpB [Frankliniella fusca]|uniref:Penicillin-binding protein PbpB n=1 Tax=Frankliniella fusca TaxID=407009 RepID=A0AAE1LWX0_9NEOP|nr:Penicillin-binding protein PbpB [Frankliniella fusca]
MAMLAASKEAPIIRHPSPAVVRATVVGGKELGTYLCVERGSKEKVKRWLKTNSDCRRQLQFTSPKKGKRKKELASKVVKCTPNEPSKCDVGNVLLPSVQNEKVISSHNSFTVTDQVSKETGNELQDADVVHKSTSAKSLVRANSSTPLKQCSILSTEPTSSLQGKDISLSPGVENTKTEYIHTTHNADVSQAISPAKSPVPGNRTPLKPRSILSTGPSPSLRHRDLSVSPAEAKENKIKCLQTSSDTDIIQSRTPVKLCIPANSRTPRNPCSIFPSERSPSLRGNGTSVSPAVTEKRKSLHASNDTDMIKNRTPVKFPGPANRTTQLKSSILFAEPSPLLQQENMGSFRTELCPGVSRKKKKSFSGDQAGMVHYRMQSESPQMSDSSTALSSFSSAPVSNCVTPDKSTDKEQDGKYLNITTIKGRCSLKLRVCFLFLISDLVTAKDSQGSITVIGLVTPTFTSFNSIPSLEKGENSNPGFVDTLLQVISDETTPKGAKILYEEPLEDGSDDGLSNRSPKPIQRTLSIASNTSDHILNPVDQLFDNDDISTPTTPVRTERARSVASNSSDHNSNPSDGEYTPHVPRKRTRTPGSRSGSPVRKRLRDPSMWKKQIRKTAKNCGQEYVSARGKTVSAKQMKPGCSCKFDCLHRITEEQREHSFRTFWNLGDHDRQWEFIRAHSKSKPTKSIKGKRNFHRTFYLHGVKVCKKMFTSTLSICHSWIDSAYSHVNSTKGNTSTPDKRGRHQNHPVAVTPEKINSVKDHVAEFPRMPSHYCRQRTKKEYLENGLSLKQMAKQYSSWAERKNLPAKSIASPRQYVDIVNSHFNLGFLKPKKDQCKLCAIMRSKDNCPAIREKYKNRWITHIKNKDFLKKIKEKDKAAAAKDKTIALCSFDLQKQLSCPKSEASPFFYSSKLNVYNFTVFHSIERVGFCYLWHEGMAKKGSDEISSSLFHFITYLVEKGFKEIVFYSDNCAGQNKNRFLFSMLQLAAVKYSIKITHRFLEPGHTMMEVDSIHARIEKSTKGKEIFDFKQWIDAIENAKEELPKYKVIPFKKEFVKTYKPLVNMQNWETDLKGKKVAWSRVKEVQIIGSEGNLVRLKYEHDEEVVTISPNKPGRPVNLKTYNPPPAYNSSIPLPANTMKCLKSLCDSLAIPASKHAFYDAVLAGCHEVDDNEATDPEYNTDEEVCTGEVLEEAVNKEGGSVSHAEESDEIDGDL